MPLDERRIAMLREIGVPVWQRLPVGAPPARAATPVVDTPDPAAAATGVTAETSLPSVPVSPAPAAPQRPLSGAAASVGRAPAPMLSPGPVADLDWAGLREAVAACRACGLCETRKQTVFGVGHPQAHWMVVGEAPGEQEDLQGEPFVGAAGQLLDNMLRALGLSRAEAAAPGESDLAPERQVYITNTLKCRPPRNRNPERDELARCEPFLVRQIELLRPRLILAMGRFAVQALLRSDEPIGRLRGRVHRYQGVPLIVTYHPAYLLRNLADKARAWEDLCLAHQTMANLGVDGR